MNKLAWQPSASIDNLLKRAEILKKIRFFFNDKGLLEVETPVMSHASVTDIYISQFLTRYIYPGRINSNILYLISSPEYHMKRLIAAGSGSIFQLCRSFRNEETGRYHNPEFTMLEWYRLDYDMYCLMNEINDLLKLILNCDNAEFFSYQEIFGNYLGIDPLLVNQSSLNNIIKKLSINKNLLLSDDYDSILQLLFTIIIAPSIGHEKPIFIYHFPASQAILAKINNDDNRVADRFEVYYKGIELANGSCELTNANEMRQRFIQDNCKRAIMNLPQQSFDENLLAALNSGMPECSGVALGVDRLVMLAMKKKKLSEVISFSLKNA